jgi:hypothetical protein
MIRSCPSVALSLVCGLAALGAESAQPAAPAQWYEKPFLLKAGEQVIDLGEVDVAGHAAPFIQDVDGDGLRDLVVGSFVGKFRLYRNIGTDEAPRFAAESSWIQADGQDAQVPNFCCVPIGAQVADIDNDGIPDLSSGSYYPGAVYWFRGLGQGRFAARQFIVDTSGLPVGVNYDFKTGMPDSGTTTSSPISSSAMGLDGCFSCWARPLMASPGPRCSPNLCSVIRARKS